MKNLFKPLEGNTPFSYEILPDRIIMTCSSKGDIEKLFSFGKRNQCEFYQIGYYPADPHSTSIAIVPNQRRLMLAETLASDKNIYFSKETTSNFLDAMQKMLPTQMKCRL